MKENKGYIMMAIEALERSKGDDYYRSKSALGENHPTTIGYKVLEDRYNNAILYLKTLL